MSQDAARLIRLLEILIDHGSFYPSAIELDYHLDGGEWGRMAKQAIADIKGGAA